MISVTVLLTCHNRKNYTLQCIEKLADSKFNIQYIVTDDGSTDGTLEMLENLKKKYNIYIIKGTGQLFWGGGMRKAIEYSKKNYCLNCRDSEYYIFVNDDVDFFESVIEKTIAMSEKNEKSVIVGITINGKGEKTYGGIRYKPNSIKYDLADYGMACDTFNCNFVLLPSHVFIETDNFDVHYTHSLADFDYGIQIVRNGINIVASDEAVGICERNKKEGTWQDTSLNFIRRIYLKETIKGLPFNEWYYYLKKNFGFKTAFFRSISPYLKILLKK